MAIWWPIALVQQLDLVAPIFQPGNTHIEGSQTNIVSNLRTFIFEKNETPRQFLTASIILDKEEEKEDLAVGRPILPPPSWK